MRHTTKSEPSAYLARYGSLSEVPEILKADIEVGLNPVLDVMLAHRSVRDFIGTALPAGTLDLLIAAAQSAPSSSNLQVWSVIAVEDAIRRARVSELVGSQKHVKDAPLFLAWLVDLSRARLIAEQLDEPGEGIDYLDTFLMGVIDAALAAQNLATAAESLGFGTVYIGALRNRPEEVAQLLDIPADVFPVFGMVIGYPDPRRQSSAVKPRISQSAVLHRERYRAQPPLVEIANYDVVMKTFYESQNLPQETWSKRSGARLRDAASLNGRDRLRQALSGLGFKLR